MDKVVVVAPAIKIHHWQRLYVEFCRAKTPFHFVFVGHVRPNFKLPDNFTYIHCELGPAECAEIAYRYAYKKITDAKYIINIADDSTFPEYYLDKMNEFYVGQVAKEKNEFVIVSSLVNGYWNEENLMSLYDGGPTLLGPMYTTVNNSKKLGGIDSRFKAIYWDCDRHLRAHMLGGAVVYATPEQVPTGRELEYTPTGGLWNTYGKHDKGLLDDIWEVTEGEGTEIYCSSMVNVSGRPTNKLFKKKVKLSRDSEVLEYEDKHLGKYYE